MYLVCMGYTHMGGLGAYFCSGVGSKLLRGLHQEYMLYPRQPTDMLIVKATAVHSPSICHSQVVPRAGWYQELAAAGTEKSPIARSHPGPVHIPLHAQVPVKVLHIALFRDHTRRKRRCRKINTVSPLKHMLQAPNVVRVSCKLHNTIIYIGMKNMADPF